MTYTHGVDNVPFSGFVSILTAILDSLRHGEPPVRSGSTVRFPRMRLNHLLASFVPTALLLLTAAQAHATQPSQADRGDKDEGTSFGTTPARSKAQMQQAAPSQAAPTPAMPASAPMDRAVETADTDAYAGPSYDSDVRRSTNAPIATDPPGDWAILHAGLRPKLGTFGGIATLALAHARTESFYGGFSLSAVRNDAGTHIGLAQIALGRNLSDTFGGGMQVSITENRARNFVGVGQLSLAYNRSLDMTAVTQVGAFNRAKELTGVTQLGLYNRTDKSFVGATQLGVFNHSRGDFAGIAQLGVVNATGPKMFGEHGDKHQFAGITQAGVVSTINGNFYGVAQLGAASFTSKDFRGLVQLGVLGAGAGSFHGLAQTGLVAMSKESVGIQIGGGAIALEEHTGIQIGALGTYAKNVDGAQIGVANLAERVRGVQIGVFNHTRSLRGVQIGLANHAEDGVLPWTALLNMGFGDGGEDEGRGYDEQRSSARTSSGRDRL